MGGVDDINSPIFSIFKKKFTSGVTTKVAWFLGLITGTTCEMVTYASFSLGKMPPSRVHHTDKPIIIYIQVSSETIHSIVQ